MVTDFGKYEEIYLDVPWSVYDLLTYILERLKGFKRLLFNNNGPDNIKQEFFNKDILILGT